jgi:hypothetical protein
MISLKKEEISRASLNLAVKKVKLLDNIRVDRKFLLKLIGAKKKYLFTSVAINLIKKYNLIYSNISYKNQNILNLDILGKLLNNKFSKSGKNRKYIWNMGWRENLNLYKNNTKALIPKYVRTFARFFRVKGKIVYSQNYKFILELQEIIHLIIVNHYLKNIENIYEFGAGSGNVISRLMKNLNRNLNFFAADWSQVSILILKKIKIKKKTINSFIFDFFNPNKKIKIKKRSLIITNGALEQTGIHYKKFVKYIIDNKVNIVINFEPLIELYNNNNLDDYVLKLYAEKRNYLKNYVNYLKNLENRKIIKILDIKRIGGVVTQETLSFIVWKPL